jgi:hypothetical protein
MFQTILDNAMKKATHAARTAFQLELSMAGVAPLGAMAMARAQRNDMNKKVSQLRAYRITRMGR